MEILKVRLISADTKCEESIRNITQQLHHRPCSHLQLFVSLIKDSVYQDFLPGGGLGVFGYNVLERVDKNRMHVNEPCWW